jgi:hypothetical protein
MRGQRTFKLDRLIAHRVLERHELARTGRYILSRASELAPHRVVDIRLDPCYSRDCRGGSRADLDLDIISNLRDGRLGFRQTIHDRQGQFVKKRLYRFPRRTRGLD